MIKKWNFLLTVGSDVGGAAYNRDTHNMPDAVSFKLSNSNWSDTL